MKPFIGLTLALLLVGCSGRSKSNSENLVNKQALPISNNIDQTSPVSSTTNWINISSLQDGKKIDIDFNSIKRSSSLVIYRFRIRQPFPDQQGIVIFGYQQVVNCNTPQSRTLEVVALNQQNQVVINDHDENAAIEGIKEGTIQAEAYRFICQKAQQPVTISDSELLRLYSESQRNAIEAAKVISGTRYLDDSNCDYPYQRDSLGNLCGGRAASERPGGR